MPESRISVIRRKLISSRTFNKEKAGLLAKHIYNDPYQIVRRQNISLIAGVFLAICVSLTLDDKLALYSVPITFLYVLFCEYKELLYDIVEREINESLTLEEKKHLCMLFRRPNALEIHDSENLRFIIPPYGDNGMLICFPDSPTVERRFQDILDDLETLELAQNAALPATGLRRLLLPHAETLRNVLPDENTFIRMQWIARNANTLNLFNDISDHYDPLPPRSAAPADAARLQMPTLLQQVVDQGAELEQKEAPIEIESFHGEVDHPRGQFSSQASAQIRARFLNVPACSRSELKEEGEAGVTFDSVEPSVQRFGPSS